MMLPEKGDGKKSVADWKNKLLNYTDLSLNSTRRLGLTTAVAAAAKSLQSCPTLCEPIDGNLPGSAVPGILQARTLEWVAISFSNAWKWKVKVKSLSRVRLSDPMDCSLPGSSVHGFSRQEYWSGVPLPSPIEYTERTYMGKDLPPPK